MRESPADLTGESQRLLQAAMEQGSLDPFRALMPALGNNTVPTDLRANMWKAARTGLEGILIAHTAERITQPFDQPSEEPRSYPIGDTRIRYEFSDEFGLSLPETGPTRALSDARRQSLTTGFSQQLRCYGMETLVNVRSRLIDTLTADVEAATNDTDRHMRVGSIVLHDAHNLLLECLERGVEADLNKVPNFWLGGTPNPSIGMGIFYDTTYPLAGDKPQMDRPANDSTNITFVQSIGNVVAFTEGPLRNIMRAASGIRIAANSVSGFYDLPSNDEILGIAERYDMDEIAAFAVREMLYATGFANKHEAHLRRTLITNSGPPLADTVRDERTNTLTLDWPGKHDKPDVQRCHEVRGLKDVTLEDRAGDAIFIQQSTQRCPASLHRERGAEDPLGRMTHALIDLLHRTSLLDPLTFVLPSPH